MLSTEIDGAVLLEGDSRARAVTPSRKCVDERVDAEGQPDAREDLIKGFQPLKKLALRIPIPFRGHDDAVLVRPDDDVDPASQP